MKIMTLEVDEIVSTFAAALPAVVATVQAVLSAGDEDSLLSLLEDLDSCVEVACSYLHEHLPTIVEMCLAICSNSDYPSGVRSLAADIIAVMAEENGGFFRKHGAYLQQYLQIAANMMMDIDEDANWESGVFGEEEELVESDSVPHVMGCVMVSNMASSLHAAVYKPIMQLVSQCSRSQDWKTRRCVYTLISYMADGCKKQIETDLKLHVNLLLTGLNDPHPRVVFVALQAIAFVSVALTGVFQKKAGAQVVQAILQLVQKNPCLRVQAIAASALGQFCSCEMITKKIFKNVLAPLVEWLTTLCAVTVPSVQSEAITAVGNLCRATKDDFTPFYHNIVQGLINILSGPVSPDSINVHVSACVCLSSLVSSMGKATSQKEAWDIMQFLLQLIEKTQMGDERLNCLLDCAAEIFQYCERPQQEHFLSIMVPYLLKMASTDVGFSMKQVVSGPEYQMENGVERATVETHGMGKVQLSINTTAIEAISNAVRLVHNLIIDAKEMMLPYVTAIHDVVFPLTDFNFHEEVRSLCAKILPQLLELLVDSLKAGQTSVDVCSAYFKEMITTLFNEYMEEENATEREVVAECIRDALQIVYESGTEFHHQFTNQLMHIDDDVMLSIVTTLQESIDDSVKMLEAMYKEVDLDDREMEDARNEFEEAAGEEKNCVENLMDAMNYVIRLTGEKIQPLFQEKMLPSIQRDMESPFEYIQFAGVCTMDDMFQNAPCVMGNFVQPMLEYYSQRMGCDDPALRQAVLYGLKIIVERFPEQVSGQVKQILAALMNVIRQEGSLEEDYRSATDNAVSAVFSILLNFRPLLSPKEFNSGLNFVLEYLPMEGDVEEGTTVHERVVMELAKPDHGILNQPQHLQAAMQLLPLLLLPAYDDGDNEYEVVYPETKAMIISMLKSLSPKELQQLIGNQEPEVKALIMNTLQA